MVTFSSKFIPHFSSNFASKFDTKYEPKSEAVEIFSWKMSNLFMKFLPKIVPIDILFEIIPNSDGDGGGGKSEG